MLTYLNTLNDAAEAQAIASFGDLILTLLELKVLLGIHWVLRCLEAVAVVLSMLNETIPMTHGTTEIDPEFGDLNLVYSDSIRWSPMPTISNSFGFGGHNGSIVIGPA